MNVRMRTRILSILTAAILLSGVGIQRQIVQAEEITVKYDGETVNFDVPAQIIENRIMVPMRKIFEIFGSKVKWDQDTQTITARKNAKTITMTIGDREITLTKSDGTIETVTCDTAPCVVNNRTLIPLRAVSELLNLDVDWNQEEKTAEITDTSTSDDSWKDNTGTVDLSSGTVSGSGISMKNGVVTITEGGDFTITGTLSDGCIHVNTKDKVKLRLSGANITNLSGPAIYIEKADKAYITISKDTVNTLTDGAEYSGDYADLNGCIVSKDTLEIKGSGELTIQSSAHRGIKASDSLNIEGGIITLQSAKDGISVNDTFSMSDGTLNITTAQDGIASDSIVDISGGTINITTTGEVTASENDFMKRPGQQTEQTETTSEDEVSSKGIKADWLMDISGGTIQVSSTDHALKCSSDINISGGTLTLNSSVKKGIKGEGNVTIDGGKIDITQSTEGIESKKILTINDGEIHINATDDGLNAGGQGDKMMMPNGGNFTRGDQQPNGENSQGTQNNMRPGGHRGPGGMTPPQGQENQDNQTPPDFMQGQENNMTPPKKPEGQENDMTPPEKPQGDPSNMTPPENAQGQENDMTPPERPDNGNMPAGPGGMFGNSESTEKSSEHHIQINGGYLYINAKGDGIDSNGSLFIDGGTVIVDGSESNGDSALDSDGALMCGGGTVIAVGSAGMAEVPNSSSAQNSLSIYFGETQAAGTLIRVEDSDGNEVLTYSPAKAFSHAVVSSSKLETGKTYRVYVGGNATGDQQDGLFEQCSYSGGTLVGEAQISGAKTVIGTQNSFGRKQ